MKARVFAWWIVLSGCGSTQGYRVLTGQQGPPTRLPVAVVMEGARLPERFNEVAVVEAVGRGSDATHADVIAGLCEVAREVGANTVIHIRVDVGSYTTVGTGVAVRSGEGPPAPPPYVRHAAGVEAVTPPWGTVP